MVKCWKKQIVVCSDVVEQQNLTLEVFNCQIFIVYRLSVPEEQCLHQIFIDEQFGSLETVTATGKKAEDDKRK